MAEFFGVIGQLVQSGQAVAVSDYQGRQADTYDQEQSWQGDIEYYLDWAHRLGGPVLALACGTGRVALPLAQRGFQVTGLDLSQDMLAVFERKLACLDASVGQRVQLVGGDMCDYNLSTQFAQIILPCYSFAQLLCRHQREAFFACAYRHLAPGGALLLETPLWVATEEWTGNHPRFYPRPRRSATGVLQFYQTRPEETGLVTLNFLRVYMEGDGRARLEALASNEYRTSVAELEVLARGAGFNELGFYRDYRHNPLGNLSHAVIFVATR